MSNQRRAANQGISNPQDLSFLQSIFDESCAVHEHLPSEEQSAAIAQKLFVLFKGEREIESF